MRLMLVFIVVITPSCGSRHGIEHFSIVPAKPNYLLRSPDLKTVAFPDLLAAYTGLGGGWVDLRAHMRLRIENAYFQTNAPKRILQYYIGTEVAEFRVTDDGSLRALSSEFLAQRPPDQPSAQALVPPLAARFHWHRYYYQVVFRLLAEKRGAVLLGANSENQLDLLGHRLLADPDSICTHQFAGCVVFPDTCTVSLEMEIVVNGSQRSVDWGSSLASVVGHPRRLAIVRTFSGRPTPVEVPLDDAEALKLPLLPGDRITWK